MGDAEGVGTSGKRQMLGLPKPMEPWSRSGLVVEAKYDVGTGICCCHEVMPTMSVGMSAGFGTLSDST